MRRLARALIALAGVLALARADSAAADAPAGRLRLDRHAIPVDAPACVCADGAPAPPLLHVDGREEAAPAFFARPAGGDAPRVIHLALPWPARGPLRLFQAVPPRSHATDLPMWGQNGTLGPGDYVLTADGFSPETLRVLAPDPVARRSRALLARARLRAEQGDSTLAARLLERMTPADERGAYADAAALALGDLLPFSRYRDRPEGWLTEWIARRHAACVVGEGMRVWLSRHGDAAGRQTLERIVARYPETQASHAAAEWLAGP